jgi:hypothetical protein
MVNVKHCHVCDRTLSTAEFSRNRSAKDGCQTACKSCCKKRHNAYYQKNAERHKKVARVWNAKRLAETKEIAQTAKKGGCIVCGETEYVCLDFHHLDPNEKEFNIGRALRGEKSLEMLRDEIAKCEVLCANCHRKVHAGLIDLEPKCY